MAVSALDYEANGSVTGVELRVMLKIAIEYRRNNLASGFSYSNQEIR